MTDRIQRATGAIAGALFELPETDTPFSTATDLALILRNRLGPVSRLLLCTSALMSLDADSAEEVCLNALDELRVGDPLVPSDMLAEDARTWATLASDQERQIYFAAIWHHLSRGQRADFLRVVATEARRVAA